MNSKQKEHINKLKRELFSGKYVEVKKEYRIRILNRGEQLFYQEGEKAFVCEIQLLKDWVYKDSIICWDNDEKITVDEKKAIFIRITEYFEKYQGTKITFV